MSFVQLIGTLAFSLTPALVCIAAGSAVGTGMKRMPGADMLVGLGLAGGALTILAVATRLPLSTLMLFVAACSLLAAFARRASPGGIVTWVALALTLPLLVYAAGTQATLWDEFWHWLPSAAYEYTHDALARRGAPPSFSQWPAYPQTIPLTIAAASFLAHRFVESAGAVTNVALLAGYAALLASALIAVRVRQGHPPRPLVIAALAVVTLVAVLVVNPGLDGEVLLAAYADAATMVMVAALGLLGVELLVRLKAKHNADATQIAWRFGFVAAALINLKQSNPVLLVLIVAGMALIVVCDRKIRVRDALRFTPHTIGPALVVFLVWRWYVVTNLPAGEAGLLPLAEWHWRQIPSMFASILRYARATPLFHVGMWIVTAVGLAAIPHLRRDGNEARWLAVMTAIVWLGYNAFLLFVYVAIMSEAEASQAADYWRYTPHVGLLALAVPVLAIGRLPLSGRVPLGAVALVGIVLAVGAPWLRHDFGVTRTKQWALFVRGVAADVKVLVPARSKVLLAFGNDINPFPVIMHYDLWQFGDAARAIPSLDTWEGEDADRVRDKIADADYLILHDGQGPVTGLAAQLGVPLPRRQMILFVRRDGGWEELKSWPIPAPRTGFFSRS